VFVPYYKKQGYSSGKQLLSGEPVMSKPVFVVSEWLPKKGHEQELWDTFKAFSLECLEKEEGCASFCVTKQLAHPVSSGKTQFTIILMETFVSLPAFDTHCDAEHTVRAFNMFINEGDGCIVEEWRCRLFSEG
jgi:quinol monooxygenase YgiN